ncbi:MAG: cyclin-dependent kinase inhibitor 3 family protein [Gammaproteobacteria bacterium]|nr:cyclin-dependent kinase inhibitor 3 family protein [Gammaproteobacteria bacterium]
MASFTVNTVSLPGDAGALGLSACPGRGGILGAVVGSSRQAALERDLDAIRDWGAFALLTLLEPAEFDLLGVPRLGDATRDAGLAWHHFPIADFCAPGQTFERAWQAHRATLLERLMKGDRVAIHCRAGLGRSGTVAARILVDLGMTPEHAIRRVRTARPGALESPEQVDYVLKRHWPNPGSDHGKTR